MIALFIKSGRGWFWELLLWLLIVELPRVISSYSSTPMISTSTRRRRFVHSRLAQSFCPTSDLSVSTNSVLALSCFCSSSKSCFWSGSRAKCG
jgi:hypothetical protein